MKTELRADESLNRLQAALIRAHLRAAPMVIAVNQKWAAIMLTNMRSRAPVRTGRLREGFQVTYPRAGLSMEFSNAVPYFPRREFGFVGVDSLGRHYADPPRPMMRPAIETNKQGWKDDLQKEARGIFRSWRM